MTTFHTKLVHDLSWGGFLCINWQHHKTYNTLNSLSITSYYICVCCMRSEVLASASKYLCNYLFKHFYNSFSPYQSPHRSSTSSRPFQKWFGHYNFFLLRQQKMIRISDVVSLWFLLRHKTMHYPKIGNNNQKLNMFVNKCCFGETKNYIYFIYWW